MEPVWSNGRVAGGMGGGGGFQDTRVGQLNKESSLQKGRLHVGKKRKKRKRVWE